MPVWICTASATSAAVTEPKSLPPSPARAFTWMVCEPSCAAIACEASRSRVSFASRLRRIDSACATTPLVAFMARPRGTR